MGNGTENDFHHDVILFGVIYFGRVKEGRSRDTLYFSKEEPLWRESFKSRRIIRVSLPNPIRSFSPTTFYGEKLSSIRKIIKQRIQEEFAQNTIISSIPQQGRNNAKLILTLMKILDGKPVEDLNDLYVPSNALDVMTDIAIASPAVCAYRQSGNEEDAQMVAKAIVSVFNKPESAAVIDLMYNKRTMMIITNLFLIIVW